MFVALETKPHVISWLQLPGLCNAEGSEVTIVGGAEKSESRDVDNAYFRVFFPGVAIVDVHNLIDLRELGKEQLMPCDCDVWPSDETGWLIVKGYASDDVVFVGRFYSEEQYSEACPGGEESIFDRYERTRVELWLQKKEERRKFLQENFEIRTTADTERSSRDYYELANNHYERGEFAEAIELYSEAIKKAHEGDPELFKFHYNRGLAFCCLERYSEGKLDILKVLELKPDFAEGWYILGLAKEYLNDIDGAVEAYDRALELNSDFKDAQNRKELAQSKKQKSQSGLISKASPCKKDLQEHAATLEKIRELSRDGEFDNALKIADEALRRDPDDFQLLLSRQLVLGKTYSTHELCGLDEIKDLFDTYITNRIKNPDNPLYRASIAQCSTGIILYGAPGCGKTAITKTIAKQEGIQLVEVVLSEILNLWSGESEKRLTQVFKTAEDIARHGKSVILFIDEFDALGIARSVTFEATEGSWSRDLRSTFRRLFNEVENIPNLAIIGATNYIWAVDKALKREGRFGECTYVPLPGIKTREEIFRLYTKETPGHEKLNLKKLAKISERFSPADIKNVCKRVHFEVAKRIIKEKQRYAEANTEDYERGIKSKSPAAIGWIRDVARAWAEGKIEDSELDPRLLKDIDLLAPDTRTKKEKTKHTEASDRSYAPVYVK